MFALRFHLLCSKPQYELIFFLNHLGRNWKIVALGIHDRLPNGILGILCKQFFPGIVEYAGMPEPAYMFDHYAATLDLPDWLCRQFRK
jgi:hypothetical protein